MTETKSEITIGIMGLGGDGVVTAGSLLLRAAERLGHRGVHQDYYTSQIRDGSVASKISLSLKPIEFCFDTPDILLSFGWQKLFERDFLPTKETVLICNEKPPETITANAGSVYQIDLRRISKDEFKLKQPNVLSLGLLSNLLGWPDKVLEELISEEFQSKGESVVENNIKALKRGVNLAKDLKLAGCNVKVPSVSLPSIILTGNQAMAKAAIRAGCKYVGRYPITPSTDLTDMLFDVLPDLAGSFSQDEDEIAVICKAIGVSTVGVKALIATSGPGLALMLESLGLATACEIPLTLIDVQRAGPATGMATQTEQSDLLTAIWGSPGDGPRPVLAARDIESCYRLAIEALNIAEEFQVPTILLSDKWLGQSQVICQRDFLEKQYEIKERRKPAGSEKDNYLRYKITPDFISAMAGVGDEGFVYQTAASTHNEKGQPRAATEIHQLMHEKRFKKLLPLTERNDLLKIFGSEKADVGIFAWGSTGRVMENLIGRLQLEEKVKLCVPELIFPLPKKVKDFADTLSKVLFIELNHSGQFYKYLRTEIDLSREKRLYFRPGGLPFNQAEIEKWLKEALI